MVHLSSSAKPSIADRRIVSFLDAFREAYPNLVIPRYDWDSSDRLILRNIGDHAIATVSSPSAGLAVPSSQVRGLEATRRVKLLWQLSGSSTFCGTRFSMTAAAGQAVIVPVGAAYELRTSANYSILTTVFDADRFRDWSHLIERQIGRVITMNAAIKASAGALQAIVGDFDTTAFDTLAVDAAIELFLKSIDLEGEIDSVSPRRLSYRLQRAKAAAVKNISNSEYSPDQLARDIGLSKRALYLEFSRYGLTPGSFIRDLRLSRIRQDILSSKATGLTLTEIAFRNGFSDSSQFSRSFRARYGISPRELRAKL